MPARRCAGDADAIRIDLVIVGVRTDVTHRSIHVEQNLRNGVARLAAMHDGEDGEAPGNEWLNVEGNAPGDVVVVGVPAAADDVDARLTARSPEDGLNICRRPTKVGSKIDENPSATGGLQC